MGTLALFLGVVSVVLQNCSGRKNVLFLIADDLRPEISAYYEPGSQLFPKIHTPNIDALVAKSLVMKKAYVQFPQCGPSRTSFMTGRRPDTTRVYNLADYWRNVGGDFNTLPEHFKLNGYNTAGHGKIFHPGASSGFNNDAQSWTESYFNGVSNHESSKKSWSVVSKKKLKRKPLVDEQIADAAISTLQSFANDAKTGAKNFFVAAGFKKPHLPFVFPKSVMKKYYRSSDIKLPTNPYVPVNMPSFAWANWGELRSYDDISGLNLDGSPNVTLPDKNVLKLRRAYYCAVTWMDEQVGRIVDELTNLGLENDTIISFVGDHGFLLGEHGGWGKYSLFELATHAPMMIHIPGATDGGVMTDQLAEFVDLYPTIVEAAGLTAVDRCPENSTAISNCTEGLSLLPLVSSPNAAIRNASFSQIPRWKRIGYSIRTSDFRYTEYISFDSATFTPDWTRVDQSELYDLNADPDENKNVASNPSYIADVGILSAALRAGWRSAIIQ